MLNWLIEKIGTLLKFGFSRNSARSTNSTSKVSAKQGHAVSTSGNHSPIHIGDVNYIKETREIVSYTNNWKALLNAFSPESAQKFALHINNPNFRDARKHNINGTKTHLSKLFKDIRVNNSDPHMIRFNQIHEKAIISIEKFYDNQEASLFKDAWAKYLLELESIKDI